MDQLRIVLRKRDNPNNPYSVSFRFFPENIDIMVLADEFPHLFAGQTVADLNRRMEYAWSRLSIYYLGDIIGSTKEHDKGEVEYWHFNLPLRLFQVIERWARRTAPRLDARDWKNCELTLELNRSQLEHYQKLYGQGRGQVDITYGEGMQARMEAWAAEDKSGGFTQQIENVMRIAANATWAHYQRAAVSFYKDYDGIYWEVYGPNGQRRMNGGIIRHENGDGTFRWATHT